MRDRTLVDMAAQAGEIMLVSGAEIYRVEDTVARILRASGVSSPIRCKTLLDGGRRRTKNLYGVFKRTVPAGQVRQ